MPSVTLVCVGPDAWEGELTDDKRFVQVRTDLDAPGTCRVTLWMEVAWGRNPCGWGRLSRHANGTWNGEVEDTVNRRHWRVSGGIEGGELIFEPAEKSK
jgi:hypothetical protein